MNPDLVAGILAAMPEPCVLIARDERIEAMNQPARALFGPAGEGRQYVAVLRQPDLLECARQALHLNRTGRARFVISGTSHETRLEVTASPVQQAAGKAAGGVLLCFRDVTELEQAGEIRRDFVANVSHELKTPLTALSGFIETLKGAARDDPVARARFLDIMEHEAARMSRLVRDLLSLSQLETEERMRPTATVDAVALVNASVLALRPVAAEAGVTLEVIAPGEPAMLAADPDQLTQVFTNLIENAIKYGGSGGRVRVQISLSPRELAFRGPGLRIEVIDYGDGFDPVHIPRLTERFYRVDSHRSREMGGTGLGLAIVKHIVTRHRGRLRIVSTPGHGSKFTVLLPTG